MNETAQILKVDETGRMRTSRAKQEKSAQRVWAEWDDGHAVRPARWREVPTVDEQGQHWRRECRESLGPAAPCRVEVVLEMLKGRCGGMVAELLEDCGWS
jgi:hypothetical protein